MKTSKKTILFVEDNQLVLTSYQACLQREGFAVEAAGDGEMALEKLPQLKPGLVILDLMLPKVNGMEVLNFIRKHDDLKQTPVLILSNAYMDDQTLRAMTAGANKRLLKTQCTPAALVQSVRELMGMAAASDSSAAQSGANDPLLKETRATLLKDGPGEITKIRECCLAYVKAGQTAAGTEHLNSLYKRVHFLCARSGLANCMKVAHLSCALEAMLFEIIFKKITPSPSAMQTITQAVDCLGRLFQSDDVNGGGTTFKAKVLVVDDDPVCNFVTVSAMKRAKLDAVSTQDPAAALKMAQNERYDIVLLDINMPGMNGYEVCGKLRLLSGYQKTPVIFVTSNSEFQARAQAVLSGGDDLIAKPISPLELALKTIMSLIKPQRQARPASPAAAAATPAVSIAEEIEVNADAALKAAESEPAEEAEELPVAATAETGSNRIAPPLPDEAPVENVVPLRTAPPLEFKAPPPARFQTEQRIQFTATDTNKESPMKDKTENGGTLDRLASQVACVLFGDGNLSGMPLRLTRIALERYNVPEIIDGAGSKRGTNGANGKANGESFEGVVREVTRIIFGDEGVGEMPLRLTRIALERYNVPETIANAGSEPALNGRNGANGANGSAHNGNKAANGYEPAPLGNLAMKG